jgi:hypothetical protein
MRRSLFATRGRVAQGRTLAFAKKMIPELKMAGRTICERLRHKPYQRGVTITAWDAIIDQRLDGRRCGAFSWQNAVEKEAKRHIGELDAMTKRKIWESTEDSTIIPDAGLKTITECLYPFVFDAANRLIHKAVVKREREREANTASHGTLASSRP